MKSFKQYICEKLTIKQFNADYNKSFFNSMSNKQAVDFFIKKTGKSENSAVEFFKDKFNLKEFPLNEDTDHQLQQTIINDLNLSLQTILKNSKNLQDEDFKKFFNKLTEKINPIFSDQGFEVFNLNQPQIIIKSGLKDSGEENFKIAADNIEFENIMLNIKWSKDENGYILINLEVRSK